MRIGCVVLAAGAGRRFGENKLTARFRGRSLIERALEAVPVRDTVVVTRYPEVKALAEKHGFGCVWNEHPELGQSRSVRLGTEALRDCGAILYMVADQPLLRRESAAALVEFFRAHPDRIVAAAHNGVRGNPCIFPAGFFPALMALTGDRGGGKVIADHPEALLLYELPPEELIDTDTRQALAALTFGEAQEQ